MYPNEKNFYTSIYVHIDFEHYQYVLSMNQYEQDQLKNIYQLIVMHSHHKLIHNHSKMTKVGCLYPRGIVPFTLSLTFALKVHSFSYFLRKPKFVRTGNSQNGCMNMLKKLKKCFFFILF
jgi:hypothetical protein